MNAFAFHGSLFRFTAPEPLEYRIAPAVIFVSGVDADFTARSSTGSVITGDVLAKVHTGADIALLLNAGDRLVYDRDGNNAFSVDAGDRNLALIDGKRAMVFLSDVNGNAKFDLDSEITGIAISKGGTGTLFGNSIGGVVTLLRDDGTIDTSTPGTAVVQNAGITGWKIAGRVDGDILAGGAIDKLTIGSGLFTGAPALSVDGRIATGSASHGISVSFDGGTTLLTTAFTPLDGSAGPNISNVRLLNGARAVIAGDGADVVGGKAPGGGSIINLIMYNSPVTPLITAGAGGETGNGVGGAGGGVFKLDLSFHSLLGDTFAVTAGLGGAATIGKGGVGGAITDAEITALDSLTNFIVAAGPGGTGAGTKGAGGAGGAITNGEFFVQGVTLFDFSTGAGGNTTGTGTGGAGGLGSGLVFRIGQYATAFNVGAGDGGDSTGGRGGDGGDLKWAAKPFAGNALDPAILERVNVLANGPVGNALVWGGAGGTGLLGGGHGGDTQNFSGVFLGPIGTGSGNGLTVKSGFGGAVTGLAGAGANGGNGGNLGGITVGITSGPLGSSLNLEAGYGGSGGLGRGSGGHGGSVADLRHFSTNLQLDYRLRAGDGGAAGSVGDGSGGKGGSLSKLSYFGLNYSFNDFDWIAGDGGDGHGDGAGGEGGGIRDFSIGTPKKTLTLNSSFYAHLGNGGDGGNLGTGGAGGRGGSFVGGKAYFNDILGDVTFDGGGGGAGAVAKNGGNAGTMSNWEWYSNLISGNLTLTPGLGGLGGFTGAGGNGFGFSKTIFGASEIGGDFRWDASAGGNGARGGTGGSFTDSCMIAHRIGGEFDLSAGAGGHALSGNNKGGAGGGFTGSKFDIGPLTGATQIFDMHTGAGGNASGSGLGGVGGPILRTEMFFSDMPKSAFVFAGKGGDATGAGGKAGGGGYWSMGTVNLAGNVAGDFSVFGGAGGLASNGKGGNGGGFDKMTFNFAGSIAGDGNSANGTTNIVGGQGNNALSGFGVAGNGGKLLDLHVNYIGFTDKFLVSGGFGGQGAKSGGHGGDTSKLALLNYGAVGEFTVRSGQGGASFDLGGNGGVLNAVTVDDFTDVGVFILQGNDGGQAVGVGGRGGNSGAVTGLTLEGYDKTFQINLPTSSGGSGGSGAASVGGDGAAVSKIHAFARELSVYSADGGDADGSGGDGGSINNVFMIGLSLRLAVAGDGGDGATAGGGGSISATEVLGSIGDFTANYGFTAAGMGGLSAGQRGIGAGGAINGSISGISADRIAAIVAGAPNSNALTTANAVYSLSGIDALVLGADVNGNGVFDFTNVGAAGFNLGDGDTALDGIIIVRSGGLAPLTVPAMKLVTVP